MTFSQIMAKLTSFLSKALVCRWEILCVHVWHDTVTPRGNTSLSGLPTDMMTIARMSLSRHHGSVSRNAGKLCSWQDCFIGVVASNPVPARVFHGPVTHAAGNSIKDMRHV